MVLSACIDLDVQDSKLFGNYDVTFLSIGTDGIDGPTDAAGAVANHQLLKEARAQGLPESQTFLAANDSYQFFSLVNDGKNLIKIGHTGTNVMDLQLLSITPKKV
jgi:glycerate 2-kinase